MISVRDSRELQASVLALKAADRELRSDINRATTQVIGPVWKGAVADRGRTALDVRFLYPGTRVKGGNPAVAIAANSRRGLGKGRRYVPAVSWPGVEFGANRNAYSRYTRRSKKGGTHTVERRTMRHLPPRTRKGRVVYPAFAEIGPRVVSLWVQLIVSKYNDAAEGR